MKYIRTYETEEKFLTDKDSMSRGFRLKPTLYKYSGVNNGIYLELDDPRKHGDSTYMEITLDSDVEFSFYIGNKSGDTQTTMNCSIDWGDGTVETKTITKDDKGFKLSHNYVAGSYKIELYSVERDCSVVGDTGSYKSLISHPSIVKRVILGSGIVSIGDMMFTGCSSLTSINIPEGVTSIGVGAFYYCGSLTSINIPESVVSIGDYTFDSCTSLTSILIPNSVTSIDKGAFYNCSRLTSVVLPNNATIHSSAFKKAGIKSSESFETTIDSVVYTTDGSSLTVGNYTFNSVGPLTFYLNGNSYFPDNGVKVSRCDTSKSGDLIIPSAISYNGVAYNVNSIENSAFKNCSSLTSIHIPEGVTSIGDRVFQDCTSLTSVYIPGSITLINSYAFLRCSSLTSVYISEGVTEIGWQVFYNCSSLTSVTIPESVTIVGKGAFSSCTSLTSISSLNSTAPTLGDNVFFNLPTNGTLHIKPGATGYDAWLSKLPSGWTIVEDL